MKQLQLLLALTFLLIATLAAAEQPDGAIEWQNLVGGGSEDRLAASVKTADGGYFLAGSSFSGISADKTEANRGSRDYWVVKLDVSGNIEWDRTYGSTSDDQLFAAVQTLDGGYFLGGLSDGGISGDKTESNKGSSDYWVIKLDAAGNMQWQNTIGGSGSDYFSSGIQTSDGGYLIGGSSWSGISGDKTEANAGNDDCWILKLDSSGTIIWQNTIGGSGGENPRSLIQAADGGYLIGNTSDSPLSGDKTETNHQKDYWVVKLDASGNIAWQNTIGGVGTDELQSIIQTSDGGYFLGGWSYSVPSLDKTEGSQGDNDYWVLKLNSSGTIEWQNTVGGNSFDFLHSVIQTNDGGYMLGGESSSGISGDKTEAMKSNNFNYDNWIIKLDGSGNLTYENSIGGKSDDKLQSVIQANDGGYALVGYSFSNNSKDIYDYSNGNIDYCIVKLWPTTISTGIISGSPFCPEAPVTVPFTSLGIFNSGNVFTAQLSDQNGKFTVPTTIGTLNSTANTGSIAATIPSKPKAGTQYRIRVSSSNPVSAGIDNRTNLQIMACGVVTTLSASGISATSATLQWTGVSCAVKYKVQYRKQGNSTWTTNYASTNSYIITGLMSNTTYEYRVQTYCSANGSAKSGFTIIQSFATMMRFDSNDISVKEIMSLYPNPSEGQTTIHFTLLQSAAVCITVYDVTGKEIETLLSDDLTAGEYSLPLNTSGFSKGIYLAQMISGDGIKNEKLVVE